MKKIPSLFIREFEGHKVVNITRDVTTGCEWVMEGEGKATLKVDGTCCMIKEGKLYKRYDAKKGKKPPIGAIPCQPEPDPITSHWPHWVLVDENKPEDKWFALAMKNHEKYCMESNKYIIDATYELCGPHFQGNPYDMEEDLLFRHGEVIIHELPRTYEAIRDYLESNYVEGIVFHRGNGDMCKIKRTDFGFEWNNKKGK